MKNYFITTCILGLILTNDLKAQDIATKADTVVQSSKPIKIHRSIRNIQLGLVTAAANVEYRLASQLALKLELSINYSKEYNNNTLRYSASLQPRYYHNYITRSKKGKNVELNAADFAYAKLQFYPSPYLYADKDVPLPAAFQALVGYGLRRNINTWLHTELGLATGLRYNDYSLIRQDPKYNLDDTALKALSSKSGFDLGMDIMIRIGIVFRSRKN